MHFEAIRDFEWFNEPEFGFSGGNLAIKAAPCTDFWQDFRHNISKDNGHFFFTRCKGSFCLNVKWKVSNEYQAGGQSGLMARINTKNWCKIALVKNEKKQNILTVSVTHSGVSDLAQIPLNGELQEITYRLQLQNGFFLLSFSADGSSFIPVRQFQPLTDYDVLSVGAYICSPENMAFNATLTDIRFA